MFQQGIIPRQSKGVIPKGKRVLELLKNVPKKPYRFRTVLHCSHQRPFKEWRAASVYIGCWPSGGATSGGVLPLGGVPVSDPVASPPVGGAGAARWRSDGTPPRGGVPWWRTHKGRMARHQVASEWWRSGPDTCWWPVEPWEAL